MVELPITYLKCPVSLDEVVARYDFENCNEQFQADWKRLLAKRKAGDELWEFEPPEGDLRMWGIALVRDGCVISTLIDAVD